MCVILALSPHIDVFVCHVLWRAVLCSDGMATIGEELSDDEGGGLRVGDPGGAAYRPGDNSSTRQFQDAEEHDFDSTRGSM